MLIWLTVMVISQCIQILNHCYTYETNISIILRLKNKKLKKLQWGIAVHQLDWERKKFAHSLLVQVEKYIIWDNADRDVNSATSMEG